MRTFHTVLLGVLLLSTLAMAGWNKATYAVVNKMQLDLAIYEGRVNPVVLAQKQKGHPYTSIRISNDGKQAILKAEVPGDIAYLRARAAAEGIEYSEYNADEIKVIVAGTNWANEVEQGE